LLWQLAYAELLFVDDYWPDFTPSRLHEAIEEYNERSRRYGGL
jgi:undecaprenyl diphosphate synthase